MSNPNKDSKNKTKIRKYADFFPEKNKIDKEIISTFFPNDGFQHDLLGYTSLNTSDTIKAVLFYFKKNIIDSNLKKSIDSEENSTQKHKNTHKKNISLE
jgi:hypothetical protein